MTSLYTHRSAYIFLGTLFFFVAIVWSQVYEKGILHADTTPKENHSNILTVAVLDIGQGDAIYVETPNGRQMIIDGGPKDNLLYALKDVMSSRDKSIDVLVITNPDVDHYNGFISLLETYTIGVVVEPGTNNDSPVYDVLEQEIISKNIAHTIARKGQRIILDKKNNIYFEILFPDRDVSTWETNNGSIVGRIVYGDTSFLMMGDASFLTEGLVVANNDISGTDVLKVGHHGSKTSTGVALLEAIQPSFAVISAGAGNRYGHPTPETLARLSDDNIPTLVTIQDGTVVFFSDGKTVEKASK